MTDRYSSFSELSKHEQEGTDYRILLTDREAVAAVIAPHGGYIEPGTSEIAREIAGTDLSLYCFEGLQPGRAHRDLHITSTNFDEPSGCALVARADIVIALHGRMDRGAPHVIWIGGLDRMLKIAIGAELKRSGFVVDAGGHGLPGTDPQNICNRGRLRRGVQLELPRTLRDTLREDPALKSKFAVAARCGIGSAPSGPRAA